MNKLTKILHESIACKTIICKDNIFNIIFEDGSVKSIHRPDYIVIVGEGGYALDNYGTDYSYLFHSRWDFTKDPYCPVLFKSEKWGFINKRFEIVSQDLYDSVGTIHIGHGCHTFPFYVEFAWKDDKCGVKIDGKEQILQRANLYEYEQKNCKIEYVERIASISNLTIDAIIENCRQYIPDKYHWHPYTYPELNHGLDLLTNDEALDCYMAAYGEMHHSKCKAVLQNIPFPPADVQYASLALEIVDWGCGQGIGALSVIDFLKERELTQWLKRVTLIEPSKASLDRAIINVASATNNGVRIVPINEYLPTVNTSDKIMGVHFEQRFVIHLFSNILDVSQIDLGKLAQSIEAPGHTHYILCAGPLNANAFRMDRFCEIFRPQAYFSNISNKRYGLTSDTNYGYTCKTRGFVYEGTSLDLGVYNPLEKATMPVYGEYDVNLHIQNKLLTYDKGWVYYHLQSILSTSDILYIKPDINGTTPDFVIIRPNIGIIIISVFEEKLSDCSKDDSGLITVTDSNDEKRLIESPYSSLEVSHNLIIESIKEFTEAVIDSNRNLGLVKKVLICSKGTSNECINLLGQSSYISVYGTEFVKDSNVSKRLFSDLCFHYQTEYFNNTVLNRLKRALSPQWHSYREGQDVKLSTQQKRLSKSIAGALRKISGVAGAGKTQVLATRAVDAQVRTGGEVLLLTFNITLVNYMRMRIDQVRADFRWDKINIDYYHRFFRKHANANNLHVYRESYDNVNFFQSVEGNLPKFDAVFIDEVQDYLTNWLQLLKQYFLKPGGEFVVFGDPKQNIYHRELDSEGNIKLGVIPGVWNKELSEGHRFSNPSLVSLATDFQRSFNKLTETVGAASLVTVKAASEFQFNLLKYAKITQTNEENKISTYTDVYNLCMNFIKENSIDHKDVAILAPQTDIIRFIDYKYRKDSGRKTTVTFVKQEMLDKISRQSRQASYEYERDNDRLEKVEKNRFTMVTNNLKLSTIQSFKGWEAPTIICIIQNVTSPELIYTGITRAKENLLVINIGENHYHEFFNSKMQSI